jgi:hypothetical protein
MTDTDRVPVPSQPDPTYGSGPATPKATPKTPASARTAETAGAGEIADAVLNRIGGQPADGRQHSDIPSVDQAVALRDQAPELYDLWLKVAQEKANTANYVDRAPYEIPERLAQSGRPRALGALVIVLSFCAYLAWLGGPGPYIGGLIAILDLVVMFGMFFGLRPDRLPDAQPAAKPPLRRRLLTAVPA